MLKRISPPQVLLVLALAPLGLLAPNEAKIWATLAILIGCGLAIWGYQSIVANEHDRAEARRHMNDPEHRGAKLWLHRGLCVMALLVAAMAFHAMTRPETFEAGAILTAIATALWCLSRMVADMYFAGSGSVALFLGRSDIVFVPPAKVDTGPARATFGPLDGGSAAARRGPGES